MTTTHVKAHQRAAKLGKALLEHDQRVVVNVKGKKYVLEHKNKTKASKKTHHVATLTEEQPATTFSPKTRNVIAEITYEQP